MCEQQTTIAINRLTGKLYGEEETNDQVDTKEQDETGEKTETEFVPPLLIIIDKVDWQ